MVEKYVRRRDRITYKELEEENELLLVDEKKSEAHVLNADAGGVWLLCNGKRSEEEMVRILKESMPEMEEIQIREMILVLLNCLKFHWWNQLLFSFNTHGLIRLRSHRQVHLCLLD